MNDLISSFGLRAEDYNPHCVLPRLRGDDQYDRRHTFRMFYIHSPNFRQYFNQQMGVYAPSKMNEYVKHELLFAPFIKRPCENDRIWCTTVVMKFWTLMCADVSFQRLFDAIYNACGEAINDEELRAQIFVK